MTKATLQLHGKFELTDADGVDLTPRSTHACAVLAVLALSEHARRTRRDLEALLWSTDPQLRQVSLRACLSTIRKSLARSRTKTSTLLQADRRYAWLDTHLFTLADDQPAAVSGELLEGLEVKTPAFNSWLKREREREARQTRQQGKLTVRRAQGRRLWIQVDEDVELDQTVDQLQRQLFANFKDQTNTCCVDFQDADPAHIQRHDILLQIVPHSGASQPAHALVLKRAGGRELLWRGTLAGCKFDIQCLAHQIMDHVQATSWRAESSDLEAAKADYLTGVALRSVFSFAAVQLLEGRRLLAQAQSVQARPQLLAWQCLTDLLIRSEVPGFTDHSDPDKAGDDAKLALSDASDSALVLATLTHPTLHLEGDLDAASALSLEAFERNPGLAMANAAQSACALQRGDIEAAHRFSLRALELGSESITRSWLAQQLAEVQAHLSDTAAAIGTAHRALVYAPEYKSPMRLLYGLYLANGQRARARRMLDRLRCLEPGFSMQKVRDDPNYPMQCLHTTRLVDQRDLPA